MRRPEVAGAKDASERITRLYRLCYGRLPMPEDAGLARGFTADNSPATWDRYAQALMLANEFVFVD
jgi:hypothetical protein